MGHDKLSEMSGQTVTVMADHNILGAGPHEIEIEDWWDRVSGSSWTTATGNPAAQWYAIRIAGTNLPFDDEVLYGKIRSDGATSAGILFHVSEIVVIDKEAL